MSWLQRALIALFVLFIVFAALVTLGAEFLTDWLWFDNLGFESVFWTLVGAQWVIRLIFGLAAAAFIFFNLSLTRSAIAGLMLRYADYIPGRLRTPSVWKWIFALVSLFFGFTSAATMAAYWEVVLKYFNRTAFGTQDPIFNLDIGYFVFQLPFFQLLNSWLMGILILTLLLTGILYLATGSLGFEGLRLSGAKRAKTHLSLLLGAIFVTKAWGYVLAMHRLVYSPRGVVFGASYTDVHVSIPVFKILAVIALFASFLLLVNIFRHSERLIIGSLVTLAVVSLLLGSIVPDLYQRFVVEPNELEKETPFIRYNIDYTRAAYDLDSVVEREFQPTADLSLGDIQSNPATIGNIRLWDWRPLRETYRQLQEIRPYYEFNHVDVDRYEIDGVYRQVMLAPRELSADDIPNKTWINMHMQYTHGYGLVMNAVNEVTTEGLPSFLISNIPPVSRVNLNIERPEIYYGERTDQYVLVKTDLPEFDYPQGDENAYTTYTGRGGVQISSLLTRLAFAIRFSNMRILLTNDINPESRLMFYRDIQERIRKVAPFLRYDNDPYIVLQDGRLFWIQDAYTTTNQYPFSEPFPRWGNYIRNSVKVTIDAYNGDMVFWVTDDSDPIIQTYQKMFPALFRPIDEMPEGLKDHIRYPEDLFNIQARVYAVYHMDDPNVFYNREDQWNIPQEIVAGDVVTMEPYYVVMQLPQEQSEAQEMVLMLPFTPNRKRNMVAWLAARNDRPNYGELIVYKFPKQELTYGPQQIEAQIDQDGEISQLLTLWSQRGSSVNRGNLLVIPLKNSILYVEPIYLQAEQSRIPQLRRVIVAYGTEELRVVMEPTLEEALSRLFAETTGEEEGDQQPTKPEEPEPTDRSLAELIQAAADKFEEAQRLQQEGDWAGYGRALSELEELLRQLENSSI